MIDRTPDDEMIWRSMGIRSAGSHDGVVFMAGCSVDGGVIMFAFDTETKAYLGSHRFTEYRTIRKWLFANGELYTGMASIATFSTGHILRWFGSRDDLRNFQVVDAVAGLPRELAEYIDSDGRRRIAVSANDIRVSPPIYYAGLLPRQAGGWKKIWSAADYEPDPLTRSTYVGGGLYFFHGWLYFGTMHIPLNAMDSI